jgi:hypothetical protein
VKLGLIVNSTAYEAPPDFVAEILPLIGVTDIDDLSPQHLRLTNFREYHPDPIEAVEPLFNKIIGDERARSNMEDAEARKWFDLLVEFWNWAHWQGWNSKRAYAVGYAAMLAANNERACELYGGE